MCEVSLEEEIDLLRFKVENLMNETIDQQTIIINLKNQIEEKNRLLDIITTTTATPKKKTRKTSEERQKMLKFYHENKSKVTVVVPSKPHWLEVKKITDSLYVKDIE